MMNRIRVDMYRLGIPYLDVWSEFKRLIETAGHSIEDGWSGYTYTTDSLHPNLVSSTIIADYMKSLAIGTKLD